MVAICQTIGKPGDWEPLQIAVSQGVKNAHGDTMLGAIMVTAKRAGQSAGSRVMLSGCVRYLNNDPSSRGWMWSARVPHK